MNKLLICIAILFSILAMGFANPTPGLNQKIENADSLTVGSPFDLYFSADVALGRAVVPDSISDFKVISNGREQIPGKPDRIHLKVIALKTGALSFPQLRIIARGDTTIRFESDRFRVNIQSVRAPGDTLLRDLKPVQHYPLELAWWMYLLLIGLAVFLLIIVLFMFVVPALKRKKEDVPVVVETKAVWQIALEALQALLAKDLIAQNKALDFYFELSLILRTLLEHLHGFNAIEMTTTEIRAYLREHPLHLDAEKEVIEFLQYCDKVKFAKYAAIQSHIDEHVEWLRAYIMQAIPHKAEKTKDA